MDQEYQQGRRLPGPAYEAGRDDEPEARYAPQWRDSSVRRTRRASNWTAAALIAGVAATSGYFVHAAATPGVSTGSTSVTSGVAGHGQKPSVSHAVVTSGGSGVSVGGSGAGGSGGGSVTWRDS